MNILRNGDKNITVIQLQLLLNENLKPKPNLKSDGNFGKNTNKAVIAFQTINKLKPDGIVGNKTWHALGIDTVKNPNDNITLGVNTPWFDVAKAENGIKELKKKDMHNARILEYHATTTLGAKTDEIPWCSSFVNWVVIQSGFKGTNNALAKSWLTWGKKISTPQRGDIVILKKKLSGKDNSTGSSTGYHVAFFDSTSNTHIRLLGGNQRDQVKFSTYNLKSYDVLDYRRPNIKIHTLPAMHIDNSHIRYA